MKKSSNTSFSEIANSYRQLLSEGRISVTRLSLRDYCHKRHVSYADFLRWALMSKAAAGLPGIFGEDKAIPASCSNVSSRPPVPSDEVLQEGVLYPVDFTSPEDVADASLENPAGQLSGVHIRFADGTSVFIHQGSAHQISCVINACKP